MVYYIGHFNIEDLIYPHYSKKGTAGGACLYAAMGGYIWNRNIAVISRIGSEYPKEYLELLDNLGVKTHLQVFPGETMASVTEYVPGSDRKFMMKNCPAKLLELTPFPEDVKNAQIPEGSHVHIGPLNLDLLEAIVNILVSRSCVISIDTCDSFVREDPQKLIRILKKADYFMPSASELMSFETDGRTLLQQAAWLMAQTGHPVIVKDSTNGSFIPVNGSYVNIPIYDIEAPVDLTGAGDSFCGAMMANLSAGQDLTESAIRASISSSLAIQGCGALHYHDVSDEEKELRYQYIKNKLGGNTIYG